MHDTPIRIAPTEWEVLEILWAGAPLSAAEVFERLPPDSEWTVKTVRAFLDRLIQKQAVTRRKVHGIYVFEPVIERTKCLRLESRSFLDRFFRGNPVSMISHFIEQEQLSQKDIARLQELLDAATGQRIPQRKERASKKQ
jgi:BlaI family penicillinase repressor